MAFGLRRRTRVGTLPLPPARAAAVRIELLGENLLLVNAGGLPAYDVRLRVTDVDPGSRDLLDEAVRAALTNPVDLAPRETAMVRWCTGAVTRARFEVSYRVSLRDGTGATRNVVARSAVRDGVQVHPGMLD